MWAKINKIKTNKKRRLTHQNWFFERKNKVDKPKAILNMKNKREEAWLISGIKENVITDMTDIKRIVKKYVAISLTN